MCVGPFFLSLSIFSISVFGAHVCCLDLLLHLCTVPCLMAV